MPLQNKFRSLIIASCAVVALAGIVSAQHNNFAYKELPLSPEKSGTGGGPIIFLHDTGGNTTGASGINRGAAARPAAKPKRDKTPSVRKPPAPGNWALGFVYPGAAIKYRTGGSAAWEVKAQAGSGVFAAGPRFYHYFGSSSGLSLFCGAEGDYISFKGKVSKGSGFAGGVFAGGELSFTRQLSLSMDFGPMYINLNDGDFSESISGVDYIINMGLYWRFK